MHVPFRSHPTKQDALFIALQYAHRFGLSNSDLSRNYDLCRNTLTKIQRGATITYNRQWYYDSLVLALNDARLKALNINNDVLASEISRAIVDVCLVNSNIASDAEIARSSIVK